MLFLGADDVMKALTLAEVMDAVEESLRIYESGDYEMPDRLSVSCGGRDVLILMPCVAGGSIVTKTLTIYPDNPARNRPMIDGIVMLASQADGEILALMDAKAITAMRTGAVTGTSIRYLARSDARSVGLVGCGTQGYYQLMYACAAREITRVTVYDVVPTAIPGFVEKAAQSLPGIEIQVAESTEAVARNSDIVITATTARSPVFPDDPELFKGKHLVAIGSFQPEVREYPDAVFSLVEKVWVDIAFAKEESGELIIPLDKGILREEQLETLGGLIQSGRAPERGLYGTTFFKTVGMALFDLTTARLAYTRASELGVGILL